MNQKMRIKVSLPLIFTYLYFCSVLVSGFNAIDLGMWLKRVGLMIPLIILFFVVSQRFTVKELTLHLKWILYPGIFISILGIAELYLIQSAPQVYSFIHHFERHQQIMDSSQATLQLHGMVPRARAFFVEANELSQFLTLPFGFLLAILCFRHDQIQRRLVYLIGLLIVLFAQIASLSRGGILAFSAQLVAMFLVSIRAGTKINIRNNIILIVFLTIFIILGVVFLSGDTNTLFYVFGTRIRDYISEDRFVTMGRGLLVTSASLTNFILGIGVGNINISYVKEATTTNLFLDVIIESGVFGLVSFFGIIGGLLFLSYKTMRNRFIIGNNDLFVVFIGTYISFIGMLVGGMTYSPHTLSFFWFICGLLLALNNYGCILPKGILITNQ